MLFFLLFFFLLLFSVHYFTSRVFTIVAASKQFSTAYIITPSSTLLKHEMIEMLVFLGVFFFFFWSFAMKLFITFFFNREQ